MFKEYSYLPYNFVVLLQILKQFQGFSEYSYQPTSLTFLLQTAVDSKSCAEQCLRWAAVSKDLLRL